MCIIRFGALFLLLGGLSTQALASVDWNFTVRIGTIIASPQNAASIPHMDIGQVRVLRLSDIRRTILREFARILHDEELIKDPQETRRQVEKALGEFVDNFATIKAIPEDIGVNNVIALVAVYYLLEPVPGEKVDALVMDKIQGLRKSFEKNAITDSIRWDDQKKQTGK